MIQKRPKWAILADTRRGFERFTELGILAILLCSALVFSPRYYFAYSDVKFGYDSFAIIVLFAALGLGTFHIRELRNRNAAAFTVISLLLIAWAAISHFYAPNHYENTRGILFLGGCVSVGLLTFLMSRGSSRFNAVLLRWIGAIVLISSGYGILQWQGIDFLPLNIVESIRKRYPGKYLVSTFGNGVFAAQYLSPALPLLLGASFSSRKTSRIYFASGFVAGCFYLFMTLSRSGFLALLSVFAIFSIWLMRILYAKSTRAFSALLAGIFVAACALVVITYSSGMLNRFILKKGSPQAKSASYRTYIWRDTLQMISDRPLLGIGYWNYDVVMPKYASVELLRQQPVTYANERINRAHCDYLDYFAELGAPGLLLFLCLVGIGVVSTYRAIRTGNGLAVGAASAVVATSVHALVDFPTYNPASGALFWTAIGLTMSLNFPRDSEKSAMLNIVPGAQPVRLWIRAAIVFACLIPVAFLCQQTSYRHLISEVYVRQGTVSNLSGKYLNGLNYFSKGWTIAPANRELYSGYVASMRKAGDPILANTIAEQWVALEPNFPAAYNALGATLAENGNTTDALKTFLKSIRLAPTNASALVNAATLMYLRKDYDLATDYYTRTWQLDNAFAHSMLRNYADAAFMAHRDREARPLLEEYLATHPNDEEMQKKYKVLRSH